MEIEKQEQQHPPSTDIPSTDMNKAKRLTLLSINIILLLVGSCSNPLLLRLYFLRGGTRKWLSAFLQTAGFPLILPPLLASFLHRRRLYSDDSAKRRLFFLTPPLLLYSAVLGLMTGGINFIYAYGASNLPVSTSSLLISTQLGFTAFFAFLVVRQKFTATTINAVVLLTFGAVVLGVRAGGDRPEGESRANYYLGFVMTLVTAVLYALVLPLVELMYTKAKQVTYTLVIETQLIMGLFATIVCAIGMAVNNDFQVMSREAEQYKLGETKYYLVLVFAALVSQFFFVGMVGTINYSSALLAGVIIAVCIPITEVLSVIFFHENFNGEKGVALALSLWGSVSYFYGEYEQKKKKKADTVANGSASKIELLEVL